MGGVGGFAPHSSIRPHPALHPAPRPWHAAPSPPMLQAPPAAAPPPVAPQDVRRADDLAAAVAFRIGRPVDAWAVVATLESEGWRDVDAAERFGADDLFALARDLYPGCVAAAVAGGAGGAAERERPLLAAGRFTASYARGLLYALPVAGQVAALVWLGYSLWASVRLTEGGATMIALGTIASFVVTAGFVQALAHETSRLLGHGLGGQARRMAFRIAGLGAAAVLATGALGFVANLVVPYFPAVLATVGVMYYVLLGWLWLALALLYTEERLVSVAVSTTVGILPVWGAVAFLGWGIHPAHAVGLAVSVAVAAGWAWRVLGRGATADAGDGPEPPLPRSSTVVHTTLPYVGYGVLYFAVLFADRVVSWSAAGADPLAYPLWFRTDYELGMDWALPVLFVTLAALPFGVRRLSGQIHALGHVRDRVGGVDAHAAGVPPPPRVARGAGARRPARRVAGRGVDGPARSAAAVPRLRARRADLRVRRRRGRLRAVLGGPHERARVPRDRAGRPRAGAARVGARRRRRRRVRADPRGRLRARGVGARGRRGPVRRADHGGRAADAPPGRFL